MEFRQTLLVELLGNPLHEATEVVNDPGTSWAIVGGRLVIRLAQKPEPDEGEPFHAFLADVRNRATTSLMACGLTTDGDPADIHEDVREALIEFFEEIRQRVEGPLCDLPVMIGLNAFAVCDLLLGHGGPHHPCLGTELAGRPE